ncbi:head-tail connector protein [Streptococcus sciuri]|uniref:Head-tail connector protein n=1 Tax=Streptococcus sciuri TaxID=2973939 RepID=A0ABT2F8R2_9STRE|nr:head-tail connector protein [Streptococcus sciuri]MCS4488381.1 head-tail connector protein [Streptococcus sciuri]
MDNSAAVEELKAMMAVDGNDDDKLIESYIVAAIAFIQNAIGSDEAFYSQKEVAPLFDVAVKALAGSYYQYRIALSDTQTYAIDLTLHSIVGQLRGLYESYLEEVENG